MPQIFLADSINLWDLLAVPTLVEVPPDRPQDFCWNRDPTPGLPKMQEQEKASVWLHNSLFA